MSPEVREAIENAITVDVGRGTDRQIYGSDQQRLNRFHATRAVLLRVLRELPEDMTLSELREELEIANNQV